MSAEFERTLKSSEELYAEGRFEEAYAQRFEETLSALITDGDIQGFKPTAKYSPDHKDGIDYWITTGEESFPFQISGTNRGGKKSSKGRRGSRKAEHLREKGIPWIHIRTRKKKLKDIASLKEEVIKALRLSKGGPVST